MESSDQGARSEMHHEQLGVELSQLGPVTRDHGKIIWWPYRVSVRALPQQSEHLLDDSVVVIVCAQISRLDAVPHVLTEHRWVLEG